jgi:hypothetical protein
VGVERAAHASSAAVKYLKIIIPTTTSLIGFNDSVNRVIENAMRNGCRDCVAPLFFVEHRLGFCWPCRILARIRWSTLTLWR